MAVFGFALGFAPHTFAQADFTGATHMVPFDEDTIAYNRAAAVGPVAQLAQRLESGQTKLKFDEKFGYLPALLAELKVPKSSQMFVFSKTSLQRERISPKTPRAVFFSDDVYVGFIPGAPLLEVSMADPRLGGVFYTLEQTESDRPRLARNNQCLECHAGAKTMGVPGHLMRSFKTDDQGVIDLLSGVSLVNDRTPFEERWGGWYVTGTHGKMTHHGNLAGLAAWARAEKEPNAFGNLRSLAKFFDTDRYLAPHSDIVALMVLEHQAHMHNFLTRVNYEATLMLHQYGHLNYTRTITEAFLRYLLFAEEATLTSAVKGTSDFTREFAAAGPRDAKGRSLRDFDLRTRLFRYPCSFLIYSPAFDGLPKPMRERIYSRLHEILTGRDTSPDFAKIPPETRQAILEILLATKDGLPDSWREDSSAHTGP
ncbi:MAG: hypothetical protein HY300_05215 [Verrucomicrobia bacterium]|nr:hypothetical protein [Verrucomicrobiota bacterium]